MQLLGIALAAVAGWILFRWILRLTNRSYFPWINTWSEIGKAQKYAQTLATLFKSAGYPPLALLALSVTIRIFEGQDMLATLLSRAVAFFWALLAFRILIAGLYFLFDKFTTGHFCQAT